MKIFQGFLVLVVVAILWMLPVSQGIYDFRTDVREELHTISTGAAVTTSSIVLFKPVYNDDSQTITVLSSLDTDTVVIDSYTPATRLLQVSGLTSDETRTLTVSYDIDALNVHPALNTVLGVIPMFWILILIVFPVVALVVIIRR